jgi:2-amino-4-hydroxy-6-hydroxymethyldihydropteridine diphosphokinase
VGEIPDQPDFLNAAARIRTQLTPLELLSVCKAIEADMGRDLDLPRHSPRPIDIDLLLLGEIEMRSSELTLPHPEVTSRRFVLMPLLELDPELRLPDGTDLQAALAGLGEGQRVERLAPPSDRGR